MDGNGRITMTTHLTVVHDPDLGTIAAVTDEDGNLLSTAADWTGDLAPTNLDRYHEVLDAAAAELAERYVRLHPEAADRIRRAVLESWTDEA